jgi:hypothetical protein
VKAFAKQYTNYNSQNVYRAVRGLCQHYPMLEDHIEMNDQTIRLIDKPAPTR